MYIYIKFPSIKNTKIAVKIFVKESETSMEIIGISIDQHIGRRIPLNQTKHQAIESLYFLIHWEVAIL